MRHLVFRFPINLTSLTSSRSPRDAGQIAKCRLEKQEHRYGSYQRVLCNPTPRYLRSGTLVFGFSLLLMVPAVAQDSVGTTQRAYTFEVEGDYGPSGGGQVPLPTRPFNPGDLSEEMPLVGVAFSVNTVRNC